VLRGRCDSFVVETNVHYPTDITLLYDAMRKVITLTAGLCEWHDESGWRQHVYNVKHVKRKMRTAQMKSVEVEELRFKSISVTRACWKRIKSTLMLPNSI